MSDWRTTAVSAPPVADERVVDLAGFQAEMDEMARRGWIEYYQDEEGVERVAITPAGRMRAQRAMRE